MILIKGHIKYPAGQKTTKTEPLSSNHRGSDPFTPVHLKCPVAGVSPVQLDELNENVTYKFRNTEAEDRKREMAELTGYEVKAPLLFRIVLHLTGEQVEFSWRPVSLSERRRRRESGREGEREREIFLFYHTCELSQREELTKLL